MMKSRRMRWAGTVTRMWKRRNACRALLGKTRVGDHSEDVDISGRIILKWMLEKWVGVVWTGLISLRIGKGSCEHGDGPLGFEKNVGELLCS
jgi:hypothetical protein